MIEVGYLVDSKGAQKFGTCASCGKGSDDDPKMVRVTYSHHDSISRTSNCLCADCRRLLLKTIRDGIKDEPTIEPIAQPEQRWIPCSERLPYNGKWIYNSPVTMKCDQCGFAIKDWDWHRFKFCPNCGADMRGGTHEQT